MTDLSFVNIVPEAILILVASATYVGATFTNKHRTWSYINLAALFGVWLQTPQLAPSVATLWHSNRNYVC